MSQVCEICGKKPAFGNNVSHANNKTSKMWYPNIQNIKVAQKSGTKRMNVCTRCIRSGFVEKAS